jgi:carbon-monoxide dehydrogenase medium subunit
VTIGAATRQAEAEVSEIVTDGVPLLAAALPRVGHQPTRNRGTIGGSIANGDPAAEIPLVATTLQADIVVAHEDGARTINARDFFLGTMSTALPVGGCVREVRFPVWAGARIGVSFHEISARRSDFAYVAAAAQVSLDEDERCVAIALGLGGPIAIDLHELVGSHLSQAAIADTARGCVDKAIADLDVASDLHPAPAIVSRRACSGFRRGQRWVRPLGISFSKLPIRASFISDAVAAAREDSGNHKA